MKHFIKYKRFITGLLALLVLCVGPLLPAAASALAPASQFAATPAPTCATDSKVCCPPGQTDVTSKEGGTALGHSCCPTAAVANQTGSDKKSSSCLFAKYINPLINLLSAAVGVIAVSAIIVGAIQFSSSGGDPQQAAKGKKHIRDALLGLLAYLFLYAFLQFVIPGGKFNA